MEQKVKVLKRVAIAIEVIAVILLMISTVMAIVNKYQYTCSTLSPLTLNSEGKYVMESEAFDLPKGDTRLTISYTSDTPAKAYLKTDGWNESLILADTINLNNKRHEVEYDFCVRNDVSSVKLIIESDEPQNLSVNEISLEDNNYEVRRNVVYLILITILAAILFFAAKTVIEKKYMILLGVAVVFFASLPFFVNGLEGHFGQDVEFHLLRIENIANDLKAFIIPSRIGTVWMDGEGYPSSLYYGDIILYPAAVLRIMGFPVILAFKIFMVGINALTAFFAYIAFKTMLDNKVVALICSFAYVASTYRMFDIYIRGAIGESMALVFLPVVLLGVYLVYTNKNNRGIIYNSTVMALGMTGLVCTHVMSTEMTALSLLLFGLINFRKTFTKRVILSYVVTIVETIILSLYFIVPFVDVNLHQKVTINFLTEAPRVIQHEGMDLAQFFAPLQNVFRELDYKAVEGKAVTPGILLISVLVIAVILWIRRKADRKMKITVVLSAIMLILSTNIFPWDKLSHISKIGNMLAQVQFPWRYLGIATLLLSLLTGYVILELRKEYNYKTIRNVFVVLIVAGVSIFTSNYVNDAKLVNYMDTASMDTDNVGIYEYILAGTDWNRFDGSIHTDNISKLELDRRGSSIHMDIETGEGEGTILLPVQNYYGYQAVDDKGNRIQIANGENNNISLSLPGGWKGAVDLTVGFWTWTLALIISAISFIMVIIYFIIMKKRKVQ